MFVIVTVCAAFGPTVSETITEVPDAATTFSVEAAGHLLKQTHDFVYVGRNVNRDADPCIRIERCSFWKHTLGVYDRLTAPLKVNIQMLKAKVLEAIVASHGVRPRASTIRCIEPPTSSVDQLHWMTRVYALTTRFPTSTSS